MIALLWTNLVDDGAKVEEASSENSEIGERIFSRLVVPRVAAQMYLVHLSQGGPREGARQSERTTTR